MFTGIIQGTGRVEELVTARRGGRAAKLTIDLGKLAKNLRVGDSVAINGACLTVVKLSHGRASFELVGETIKKTALGYLKEGERVNLERSLRVGDSLDGHFVLGHVDGVGTITDKIKQKDQTKLWVKLDKQLMKYVVEKGSIAIDGISLTIIDVTRDRLSVALIPYTLAVTTLGIKKKNNRVNVEIDVLGRYARKILAGE